MRKSRTTLIRSNARWPVPQWRSARLKTRTIETWQPSPGRSSTSVCASSGASRTISIVGPWHTSIRRRGPPMANAAWIQKTADRLRTALLRRYPGIYISVHFNDHVADGHGTYKGWCMSFESTDPGLLKKYGIAAESVDFTRS